MSDLKRLAREEVVGFHDAIARWAADGDPAARDRLLAHVHPEMQMIDVRGGVVPTAKLRAGLSEGGGSAPGFAIEVADFTLVWSTEDAALVTFVEHQTHDGTHVDRHMTALLLRDAGEPTRLLWRHVHETTLA